jgi:DNA-binding transcriptional ArsR family regulator
LARSQRKRFPEDVAQLADLAKALSHPARLHILRILADRNPLYLR